MEKTLISSPSDFSDRDFWENFFKARGGRPFEWYGEYVDLQELLAQHCGLVCTADPPPRILIPGCGNSELSAKLYDSGFKRIVNIDFSKVVIAEMLTQHLRKRPEMLWRIMDMTEMQFSDGAFDIVLDKGGLDALLGEPGQGTTKAVRFISEVKRVLGHGGRYACITLAQSHVIELLLSHLRHGWLVSIHRIQQLCGAPASELRPFLVVATRDLPTSCSLVEISFDPAIYIGEYKLQMRSLEKVVKKENLIRKSVIDGDDIKHLAVENVLPGRMVSVALHGQGLSRSSYSAVVLDAPESFGPFKYKCAVFLVPKGRRHEWLFSSKEGQWQVVESAKSVRLIMVFLDIDFYSGSMEDIQDDLSPLVRDLLPFDCKDGVSIPYLMSSDGVAKRTILDEIESSLTGTMLVENVVLSEENRSNNDLCAKQECYRRLIFRRNPNMIQSEALLIKAQTKTQEKAKTVGRGHKSTKKKNRNEKDWLSGDDLHVDHSFLASPYHGGMIAGLSLIASNLEKWISSQEVLRVAVVGLGAGLLPMFLHKHLPFGKIDVIELDPVVGELARRHFGFIEDSRMTLFIGDGLTLVNRTTNGGQGYEQNGQCSLSCEGDGSRDFSFSSATSQGDGDQKCCAENDISEKLSSFHLSRVQASENGLHVLIIDADSEDPSTGMSCPPAEFLEESFLRAARDKLFAGGMLIINVVARAKAPHVTVPEIMKKVFAEVYGLEVDEDVNQVLFALPHPSDIDSKKDILLSTTILERLATSFAPWCNGPNLRDIAIKLKRY